MIEQIEFPFQDLKTNSEKTGIYILGGIVLIILLVIVVTVFINKNNNTLQTW
jgi:hypothetical protein